jgi:hypothetical protein
LKSNIDSQPQKYIECQTYIAYPEGDLGDAPGLKPPCTLAERLTIPLGRWEARVPSIAAGESPPGHGFLSVC